MVCMSLSVGGRKLGMELLSLHGADELAFVQSLVNLAISTIPYGFLLNKVEKRVWLGLQRTMEGELKVFKGFISGVCPAQWSPGLDFRSDISTRAG